MKIPAVKKLVEIYSVEELSAAENAIEEGNNPVIEIEGDDEGEQLTHVYAAKWIKKQMEGGKEFTRALREFTQKVRNSIG